jgi:hypothetical protein
MLLARGLKCTFDIVTYCSISFLVALTVKKSGFVIVGVFLYTLMFEPIATSILTHAPFFRDTPWATLAAFFPVNSLNNLIAFPFERYIFREIETNIPTTSLSIACGWLVIYVMSIFYLLTKRDLK